MQGAVGTISMDAERQQGGLYQRLLFEEPAESPRHGEGSEGGTQPSPREASQASTANEPAQALTEHLMEEVAKSEKSAVAHVSERKFLGYRLLGDGTLAIAPKSIERVKQRIRQITRRNRGVSFERVIGDLNSFTTGWVTYFRYAKAKVILRELDKWLRHNLRCVRLKQRKRAVSIAAFLQQLGVPRNQSWTTAACGKGWWRMAQTPSASNAMSNRWFQQQGLVNLLDRYLELQH